MFSGDYKMAMTSLKTARWRSALTMLGIIIGVSSVVTIASLGEGLKRQIVGQINQLGSDVLTIRSGKIVTKNSSGKISSLNPLALLSTSTLTDEDVASLQKTPNLSLVAPMSIISNTVTHDDKELNNAYIVATSPDFSKLINKKIPYGSFFSVDEQDRDYAIIGPAISEKLYGEINPVGESLMVNGTTFLVRGIMETFQGGILSTTGIDLNYAVLIPYNSGKRLTENKAQISQIIVKNSGPNIDSSISDIRHSLLTTHKGQDNFTVLKQEELLSLSDTVVNIATGFISSIAAISLLVGGIGIMNIMLVSVSERTREIGIRKAVGATNRQIMNQFLIEGIMLSITGGTFGIIIAMALNFVLRIYTNFKPVMTLPIIGIAAGVSISVGIIFALAPALKASRKNPIDALRNE